MFEDLEGINQAIERTEDINNALSPRQAAYINECVEGENPSALIDRIDEMSYYQPPKGVDYDPDVAKIIDPVIDQIETKYLEAPSDLEQISQLSDCLAEMDEIRYENWVELPIEDRQIVLQDLEYRIAEIEHREPCNLNFKDMEAGKHGFYSPSMKDITMNINEVMSDSFHDYKETLDTLIHEGRHAYQDYNITEREVHPRSGEVTNWKWNEYQIGYQRAELFGFKAYAMQPIESDARAFAEDVMNEYLSRTA